MISRTLLRLVLRLVFRVEMTGDTSVFVNERTLIVANHESSVGVLRVIAERDCAPETLREILTLPLPPSWHRLFTRRLESASVEDWSSRLVGKP